MPASGTKARTRSNDSLVKAEKHTGAAASPTTGEEQKGIDEQPFAVKAEDETEQDVPEQAVSAPASKSHLPSEVKAAERPVPRSQPPASISARNDTSPISGHAPDANDPSADRVAQLRVRKPGGAGDYSRGDVSRDPTVPSTNLKDTGSPSTGMIRSMIPNIRPPSELFPLGETAPVNDSLSPSTTASARPPGTSWNDDPSASTTITASGHTFHPSLDPTQMAMPLGPSQSGTASASSSSWLPLPHQQAQAVASLPEPAMSCLGASQLAQTVQTMAALLHKLKQEHDAEKLLWKETARDGAQRQAQLQAQLAVKHEDAAAAVRRVDELERRLFLLDAENHNNKVTIRRQAQAIQSRQDTIDLMRARLAQLEQLTCRGTGGSNTFVGNSGGNAAAGDGYSSSSAVASAASPHPMPASSGERYSLFDDDGSDEMVIGNCRRRRDPLATASSSSQHQLVACTSRNSAQSTNGCRRQSGATGGDYGQDTSGIATADDDDDAVIGGLRPPAAKRRGVHSAMDTSCEGDGDPSTTRLGGGSQSTGSQVGPDSYCKPSARLTANDFRRDDCVAASDSDGGRRGAYESGAGGNRAFRKRSWQTRIHDNGDGGMNSPSADVLIEGATPDNQRQNNSEYLPGHLVKGRRRFSILEEPVGMGSGVAPRGPKLTRWSSGPNRGQTHFAPAAARHNEVLNNASIFDRHHRGSGDATGSGGDEEVPWYRQSMYSRRPSYASGSYMPRGGRGGYGNRGLTSPDYVRQHYPSSGYRNRQPHHGGPSRQSSTGFDSHPHDQRSSSRGTNYRGEPSASVSSEACTGGRYSGRYNGNASQSNSYDNMPPAASGPPNRQSNSATRRHSVTSSPDHLCASGSQSVPSSKHQHQSTSSPRHLGSPQPESHDRHNGETQGGQPVPWPNEADDIHTEAVNYGNVTDSVSHVDPPAREINGSRASHPRNQMPASPFNSPHPPVTQSETESKAGRAADDADNNNHQPHAQRTAPANAAASEASSLSLERWPATKVTTSSGNDAGTVRARSPQDDAGHRLPPRKDGRASPQESPSRSNRSEGPPPLRRARRLSEALDTPLHNLAADRRFGAGIAKKPRRMVADHN